MNQETEQTVQQFQMLEQNMTNLAVQRQQFQAQEKEVMGALEELKTTKQSYRIMGNIMVATDKDTLTKELTEKQEVLALRIKTIEKQEKQLKEKADAMQKKMMESISEKKDE